MAQKATEGEAKAGGQKKRLARAKVKRSDETNAAGKEHLSEAQRAKKRKETARNVGITVFAVVIAFAMALPSLSTIFSNNRQYQAAEETVEGPSNSESTIRTVDESNTDEENMEIVDENYQTTIAPLEERLEEDDDDLATLLNLGNTYMNYAYAASQYASGDEAQEHVNDIFAQAIEYYDRYLKLNDSDAVRVNRALCVFYGDSTQDGIDDMQALTESSPDYGPAWANLGLLYESTYQIDKAKEMYQKAAEVDADDTYGAKSYANRRLASLNASNIEATSDTLDATDSGTGLADALISASGTSY